MVLVEVAALQQAVGLVMGVLRTFPGDGDITETSCAVLWLLALHGKPWGLQGRGIQPSLNQTVLVLLSQAVPPTPIGCVKEPQLESLVTLFLKSIRLGQGRTLLVMNACRGLACLARESGEPGIVEVEPHQCPATPDTNPARVDPGCCWVWPPLLSPPPSPRRVFTTMGATDPTSAYTL